MYSKFQLAKKYFQYYLSASNGRGHGVHSPFVFEFITKVLNDDREYYCYNSIETLRKRLKQDDTLLTIEDFGAGSRVNSSTQRTVSSIAKAALKPKKFSRLFFRLVNYYQPASVIELGTSLGITSAYMASANPSAKVVTMEGAKEVAAVARRNFASLGLENIAIAEGNFDETLPAVLQPFAGIDFAFVDGNHRKRPTLEYFEQLLSKSHENTILIFDDIHWSAEMEEAWHVIQQHERVTLTIDLFFIGIVFLRIEQKVKQHFAVRF
ncbi:MAG TPA: class I SAM-dependent methyltransferase [Chitinophagaceae bacterium]|nr:class I SAM-dependent methyltransferase [Chitinophagaceae bacterium]